MNDRRGVTAGRLAPSPVAAAAQPWRVAVGGNRVQSMTVEQIGQAYRQGQLNERTPLWPPGTTGWQALGNFDVFRSAGSHEPMSHSNLASYDESDDDPTRMWTGSDDEFELEAPPPAPLPPVAASASARPSARTGPRLSQRAPAPSPYAPASAVPVSALAPRGVSTHAPASSSTPAVQTRKRGGGLMLVAGLVGLVGLGSAMLAASGDWAPAAGLATPSTEPTAAAAAVTTPTEVTTPPTEPTPSPAEPPGQAQLAKYTDSKTESSAFVAGVEPSKVDPDEANGSATDAPSAESDESPSDSEPPVADAPAAPAAKVATAVVKPKPRARAAKPKRKAAPKAAAPRVLPKPRASVAKPAPAPAPAPAPKSAPSSVNESAATALATSARLASSCRPRGGPAGPGKARVIYANDGSVKSVEILTARFRDTLTGSCVRMVFRRAKIPSFTGQPPTFIKSFTIPEE